MKTLKKSTCYKCPFYARYEAENDRQKVIAICEKSMSAYSGGYPFSISGDIRSVPS